MVMRFFLIAGLALLGITGYFVVVEQPPTVQDVPAIGEVTRLQQEGILPVGPLYENEEIEHDIFGVPPEDEEMLEKAMAEMDMGGMDMGGMEMEGDSTMEMAEGDSTMEMAEGDSTMEMAEGDSTMEMAEGDSTMEMAEGDSTMEMAEGDSTMEMAEGDSTMEMAEAEGDHGDEIDEEEADRLAAGMQAGLVIRDEGDFDREIALSMSEWTFSDLEIDAKAGERIKFTLRNDGKVLHEFMFMSMAAMQAVNYRAKRADWNLLEHEALYEKSLLLPGEEVTFVAEVIRPGVWMFMCMLPYHMQMGMMGQMATEGMAMEM